MPYRIISDTRYLWKTGRPLNCFIGGGVFLESCWLSAGKSWQPFQMHTTWLLTGCVMLIMMAGYWVNDVYDFKIDLINKPKKTWVGKHISAKKVWTAYFVCWGVITIISLLFPLRILFVLEATWILLWLYARYFKRTLVVGNLIVATLAATLVLTAATWLNVLGFSVICLAIFSFEITLLREIIKDVEDLPGDLSYQLKTLPIQAGIDFTRNLLFVLTALFLISCFIPVLTDYIIFHKVNFYFTLLLTVLVLLPLFYLIFLLGKAQVPQDFNKLSLGMKFIMLGGMIALSAF